MKRGRRNLKQGALEGCPEPQPGESLMRVVSLRGSNLFEVEDSGGEKTLCMLPAKFRKSMWIKIGNFVLVEEGDREKAGEDGHKVTGTIVQVLYDKQIRALRKTSFWPPSFLDLSRRPCVTSDMLSPVEGLKVSVDLDSDNTGSDDDDDNDNDEGGLPSLVANTNRQQPKSQLPSTGSDIDSDDE